MIEYYYFKKEKKNSKVFLKTWPQIIVLKLIKENIFLKLINQTQKIITKIKNLEYIEMHVWS